MYAQEFQTQIWYCENCGKKCSFNEDTGKFTGCSCATDTIEIKEEEPENA